MCMNLSPDAELKIAALTALLKQVMGGGSGEQALGPEPFVSSHGDSEDEPMPDKETGPGERPSLRALKGAR